MVRSKIAAKRHAQDPPKKRPQRGKRPRDTSGDASYLNLFRYGRVLLKDDGSRKFTNCTLQCPLGRHASGALFRVVDWVWGSAEGTPLLQFSKHAWDCPVEGGADVALTVFFAPEDADIPQLFTWESMTRRGADVLRFGTCTLLREMGPFEKNHAFPEVYWKEDFSEGGAPRLLFFERAQAEDAPLREEEAALVREALFRVLPK